VIVRGPTCKINRTTPTTDESCNYFEAGVILCKTLEDDYFVIPFIHQRQPS